MTELAGTLVGRWYVTLLGAVFVWRAVRDLGWRRTLLYLGFAVGVGALAENGSVHLGIPYSRYEFNPDLRGEELFVGDAPLMVAMSYAFMGYFAYASGRLLASGPWRTRGRRVWHEYLLGVMLSVWAIWLFDPIARLGDRWFLGEVFAYDGPGFWFGLPLASQLGFTLTSAILVGMLTWIGRDQQDRAVARWIDHPHVISLATYHAQLLWLGVTAIVLDETELGASALLMWVPVAAVTAVTWSNLRGARPVPTVGQDAG